jgi:hypothetical protein
MAPKTVKKNKQYVTLKYDAMPGERKKEKGKKKGKKGKRLLFRHPPTSW